jgi:Protein of unknown function (DUF2971)
MSILYKYRNWDETFHKRIITGQELYFTTPDKFNDPFDSFIRLRFESLKGKDLDTYQKALLALLQSDSKFSNVTLSELKKAKSFKNLEEFSRRNLQEMIKNIGIISLSEKYDNTLMWSHYSNNHRGFCVGFDINSLIPQITGTTLQPVTYSERYPLIKPSPKFTDDLHKQLTTKSIDWQYESEQRLISNHYINKAYKYPKNHLREIIFGCKMTKTNKSLIIKEVKSQKFPNVKFFDSIQSDKEFKIVRKELTVLEIKELQQYKPKNSNT